MVAPVNDGRTRVPGRAIRRPWRDARYGDGVQGGCRFTEFGWHRHRLSGAHVVRRAVRRDGNRTDVGRGQRRCIRRAQRRWALRSVEVEDAIIALRPTNLTAEDASRLLRRVGPASTVQAMLPGAGRRPRRRDPPPGRAHPRRGQADHRGGHCDRQHPEQPLRNWRANGRQDPRPRRHGAPVRLPRHVRVIQRDRAHRGVIWRRRATPAPAPVTGNSTTPCTSWRSHAARLRHRGGEPTTGAKRAAGKSHKEALRCLESQLSDAVYRRLLRDAASRTTVRPTTNPGGQRGATMNSSAAG